MTTTPHNKRFTSSFITFLLLLIVVQAITLFASDFSDDEDLEFINAGDATDKYALVTTGPVRVLSKLDPEAPILGMANRGKHYKLVNAGKSWVTIEFRGREGWLERNYVEIVEKKSSGVILKDLTVIISIIAAFSIIMLILLIVYNRNSIKAEWFSTTHIPKKVLIVAKDETPVLRYLTNKVTPLHGCFTELGFSVKRANDSQSTLKYIQSFLPDAIAVDWRLGKNAQQIIEQILSSKAAMQNIFVVFYNVPDTSTIVRSNLIQNSQYLPLSFNDKDLFKVITPLIITGERTHNIKKSVESAALQGSVDTGSLSEVLQFVEIGRKSGCLLIEEQKPTGIVYFNEGIINYAATRQNKGEKAVFEILNFKSGSFSFVLDKQPKTSNCSLPTIGVLMQWAKDNDEASGDRLR